MNLKIKETFKYLVSAIGIIAFFGFVFLLFIQLFINAKSPQKNKSNPDKTKLIRENYKVYSPPIPEEIDFAGEKVPLDKFYVKEALEYELLKIMYWHSETFLILKRSTRFFPTVEKILKEYNIPEDFKYLLVTESSMANVTSPAGAKGYWQFMKGTAQDYGLEISKYVDERLNLEKSTIAACKFIRDSYKIFNNWTLAAASYNVGRENLKRAIKYQKVNSFYDLLLNRETSRYIYRIIAFKIIMQNPENYGFNLFEDDFYKPIPTKTLKVDTSINSLVAFAKKYNTTYKELKILNPWLISNQLYNPNHKIYYIKVPLSKSNH